MPIFYHYCKILNIFRNKKFTFIFILLILYKYVHRKKGKNIFRSFQMKTMFKSQPLNEISNALSYNISQFSPPLLIKGIIDSATKPNNDHIQYGINYNNIIGGKIFH